MFAPVSFSFNSNVSDISLFKTFIEQYVSKQPLLPHLHSLPSFCIIICPNSIPDLYLGSTNLLFMNAAPPIPVPKHKYILSCAGFVLPYILSAIPAHLASFFIFTSKPNSLFKIFAISSFSTPKFTTLYIQLFSIVPGDAIPIYPSSLVSMSCSFKITLIKFVIVFIIIFSMFFLSFSVISTSFLFIILPLEPTSPTPI